LVRNIIQYNKMNDKERIRLIVFSAILFFILTLPFTTDIIIKLFELIFGFNNLNTFITLDTNNYSIFGRIVISFIFAIILLLLL
jgi:hypothetical protein|tara:strand:- start:1578 stop:1829 length:252 start_codon:yes stop_codon:yes gene_type:complete